MPITIVFTSGSKGGTGKSTLSSLLSYKLAHSVLVSNSIRKHLNVLLIDLGEGGSSTQLILGQDPGPPYLIDYLIGKAGWQDIICQSPYSQRLLVAPAPPRLEHTVPIDRLYYFIKWAKKMQFITLIDLPAYPARIYDGVVDMADITLLMINPDPLSFEAARNAYTGRGLVLPVLNKYHPKFRVFFEKAKNLWNVTFTFPFDPALTFTVTRTLPEAYRLAKEETRRDLGLLAQRVLKPFVKVTR